MTKTSLDACLHRLNKAQSIVSILWIDRRLNANAHVHTNTRPSHSSVSYSDYNSRRRRRRVIRKTRSTRCENGDSARNNILYRYYYLNTSYDHCDRLTRPPCVYAPPSSPTSSTHAVVVHNTRRNARASSRRGFDRIRRFFR